MPSYTVSYDLNNVKDYRKLIDELRRLGGHSAQKSYWLVSVNNTAEELHNHLKGFVDQDDSLFVSELTRNKYFSNAMKGTNDWLKNNPPTR